MRHRSFLAASIVLALGAGCDPSIGSGQTGSPSSMPPCSCAVLGGSVAVEGVLVSVDARRVSVRVDAVLGDGSATPGEIGAGDVVVAELVDGPACQGVGLPAVGGAVLAAFVPDDGFCLDPSSCPGFEAGSAPLRVTAVPLTDPARFGPGDAVPLADVPARVAGACP